MKSERIGCAIVTYNRPDSLLRLYNSIPKYAIDLLVIVNDGKYYDVFDGMSPDFFIHNKENLGVGKSKNIALRIMLENGIDHFFLIEDDVYLKSDEVFAKYINASKAFGIHHLNYSQHGFLNKDPSSLLPTPRALARINDIEIAFYSNCVGAFSYYSAFCLNKVGLMDENYYNALEHVDHTFEIIQAKLHTSYGYFADVAESWMLFGDDEWSISQSTISSSSKHSDLYNNAKQYFQKKHKAALKNLRSGFSEFCDSLNFLFQSSENKNYGNSVGSALEIFNDKQIFNSDTRFACRVEVAMLKEWLRKRVPIESHLKDINTRFDRSGMAPKFKIVIIDKEGDASSIIKSLKSLDADKCFYQNNSITVFTSILSLVKYSDDGVEFIYGNFFQYDEFVGQLNNLVASQDFDWLMVINSGEEFTPSGLQTVALELVCNLSCAAVYADEVESTKDGGLNGVFRSGFNLDYLRSIPQIAARHWIFKRDLILEAGFFDVQCNDAFQLEYILRLVELGFSPSFGHLAEPLLSFPKCSLVQNSYEIRVLEEHIKRCGYPRAKVSSSETGIYHVDYNHESCPLVSFLIPIEHDLSTIERCVESLFVKTNYNKFEIILIGSRSDDSAVTEWLSKVESLKSPRLKVCRYPADRHVYAMLNHGVDLASGSYLLFLSGQSIVTDEAWLDALLNHALRDEVGVVGAKVVLRSQKIRHAGVILGLRGPAGEIFIGEDQSSDGYMHRLKVDQNYSALSRDCMIVRKSCFVKAGAFDISFGNYACLDFCLKISSGSLIVWASRAVLSQADFNANSIDLSEPSIRVNDFDKIVYEKWLPKLAYDVAYNQNLSLSGSGFKINFAKTREWQPVGDSNLPRILCHPSDSGGCGNYRVIRPFLAMEASVTAEGVSTFDLLSPVEIERFKPTSIIYQRQFTESSLILREQSNIYKDCFRVMDMDDYFPGVPEKSIHYGSVPKNVIKLIASSLALVDRLVVSTNPLREAFHGFHSDIRVVPNRLPPEWWADLNCSKKFKTKPRVGWAGGTSHTGDLELLFDVVQELSGEVDWIFFGMCPEIIKPYISEFHSGVNIEAYPSYLASLDLDLALAPLEMNFFNECKTNLRLLEYGACGFPVICTDIEPFRCGLPVTLVDNEPSSWVDAIRMHLAEKSATEDMGAQLRERVLRDWMLKGEAVLEWQSAWLSN